MIVRSAVREVRLAVAVIVAEVVDVTCVVLRVKFAVIAPAATVRVAGRVAAALLLESWTVVAVWPRALTVTVPVDALPPTTVARFKVNAEIVGAVGGTTAPLVLSRHL